MKYWISIKINLFKFKAKFRFSEINKVVFVVENPVACPDVLTYKKQERIVYYKTEYF